MTEITRPPTQRDHSSPSCFLEAISLLSCLKKGDQGAPESETTNRHREDALSRLSTRRVLRAAEPAAAQAPRETTRPDHGHLSIQTQGFQRLSSSVQKTGPNSSAVDPPNSALLPWCEIEPSAIQPHKWVQLGPFSSEPELASPKKREAPEPTLPVHRYKRAKAHKGLGTEQDYVCGYCSRRRTSTSSSSDGRVRIRCPCGGQHLDGKSRMHATWIAVSDLPDPSNPEATRIPQQRKHRPPVQLGSVVFIDETPAINKRQFQAPISA